MRNNRDKQHLKVLQRHFGAFFIIQVQQTIKVVLVSCSLALKNHSDQKTQHVSAYNQPVTYLVAIVISIVKSIMSDFAFTSLTIKPDVA